jgi:hypothetical protein
MFDNIEQQLLDGTVYENLSGRKINLMTDFSLRRHILSGYVPVDATPKPGAKTSRMGNYFLPAPLL